MFTLLTLLSNAEATPTIQTPDQYEQVEYIGVWKFTVTENRSNDYATDVLLTSLEERTRQEILPLLQRHTSIQLITPENLQIKGELPVGNRVLDTSKALGLNYVIVGKLVLSSEPNFVLKLYHVDTGALLQQRSVQVSDVDQLLYQVPPILDDLLVPILNTNKNESAPDIIVNFSVSPMDNTLLFIDGKVTCQELPCAVKTKQGSHNIQFHNPYYEVWVDDLYLEPGAQINATLEASFGTITVESDPQGIQFQIDGISMGKTPLLKHKIEQGEHEVAILDPCYTGRNTTFTVSNSENERVKLEGISRNSGIDVFLENPTQKAKVFIDDHYAGNTPLSTSVPICSKIVRVENEYGFYEGPLNLRESEVEKLEVQLKSHKKKSRVKERTSKKPKQYRSRRFNPTHAVWSTYTVQYGLDSGDFRLNLGTFQTKSGNNDSFIAPLLPAFRGQFLDYSISSYNRHHLFPIGIGYGLDIELGLIQPYYQWQWLSITELGEIDEGEDLFTKTTYTPNTHKVGIDFVLNNNPFKYRSGHQGGTLQAQVSYLFCGEQTQYCHEEIYIGASLYLLSGRWGY